jgi:hypothetical protein
MDGTLVFPLGLNLFPISSDTRPLVIVFEVNAGCGAGANSEYALASD